MEFLDYNNSNKQCYGVFSQEGYFMAKLDKNETMVRGTISNKGIGQEVLREIESSLKEIHEKNAMYASAVSRDAFTALMETGKHTQKVITLSKDQLRRYSTGLAQIVTKESAPNFDVSRRQHQHVEAAKDLLVKIGVFGGSEKRKAPEADIGIQPPTKKVKR